MPLRAAKKSRLDLILVWTLVLGLPVLSLATVFGLRDVAAFAIAADSSDRWAGIVADALSDPESMTADGPTAEGLRRVASVLNPASPVRALICDPDGRVVQSQSPADLGRLLSAPALRRIEAGRRVRSDSDMFTGARLPIAVAESAAVILHDSQIVGIAIVRVDRGPLFNDIFTWVLRGDVAFSALILLLGVPIATLMQRHSHNRMKMDQQLGHEREVMELALAAAEAGHFERDLTTGSIWWSPRLKQILGYPNSFQPDPNFFNSLIHPDDGPLILRHIQALREFGLAFSTETRVRHSGGGTIWLRIRITAQKDADGKAIRHVGLLRDITYERQTLDALAASEAKFRNLIEGSIQGVVVYENFKPLFCNDAYARLLGYTSREELLRIPSLLVHVDADVRAKADKLWTLALQGKFDTHPARRRFIDRQGKEKWLLTIGNLIDWDGRKALLATAVDASDAVRAEQDLRDSEARFRALVESSADLVTMRRVTGGLEYASPAVERITGYAVDEIAHVPIEHAVHPDDIPSVLANNQWMRANPGRPAPSIQYRFRRKTGEWIWLERLSTLIPALGTDSAPRILSVSRNITNRVERENALREARDKLQSQTEELTALARTVEAERQKADLANAAKTRFLAVMSHELRTSMAASSPPPTYCSKSRRQLIPNESFPR